MSRLVCSVQDFMCRGSYRNWIIFAVGSLLASNFTVVEASTCGNQSSTGQCGLGCEPDPTKFGTCRQCPSHKYSSYGEVCEDCPEGKEPSTNQSACVLPEQVCDCKHLRERLRDGQPLTERQARCYELCQAEKSNYLQLIAILSSCFLTLIFAATAVDYWKAQVPCFVKLCDYIAPEYNKKFFFHQKYYTPCGECKRTQLLTNFHSVHVENIKCKTCVERVRTNKQAVEASGPDNCRCLRQVLRRCFGRPGLPVVEDCELGSEPRQFAGAMATLDQLEAQRQVLNEVVVKDDPGAAKQKLKQLKEVVVKDDPGAAKQKLNQLKEVVVKDFGTTPTLEQPNRV